jgi:hypothetical protein
MPFCIPSTTGRTINSDPPELSTPLAPIIRRIVLACPRKGKNPIATDL